MNPQTPSSRIRNLTFAVVLLVVLGIFIYRWSPSPVDRREPSEADDTTDHPTTPVVPIVSPSEPLRTKSRLRADEPKVTVERTIALLRNSKVERVVLPTQSVTDRIAAFERIIIEAGIEGREIRIAYDHQNPLFESKVKQLHLGNPSLHTVIRYICDSAKLRFRVSPGIVEFYDPASEPNLDPTSE